MAQVVLRGNALERQLEERRASFERRLDYLVVASPEYRALDRSSLWYGHQPGVITVKELLESVTPPITPL